MDVQGIYGLSAGAKGSGLRDRASSGEAKEAFSAILAEIREDGRRLAAGLAGKSALPLAAAASDSSSPLVPSKMLAKIQENRSLAKEKAREAAEIEVVRRLMPDGTIRVSKYQGGKLAKVFYSTPDKIAVPDYTDPSWHESAADPKKAGTQKKMKLVPHRSVFDGVFF